MASKAGQPAKTVVDWATELNDAKKELSRHQAALQREKAAVAWTENEINNWNRKVSALQVELCIAAGIIPNRPRPDDGAALTADELALAHAKMDQAQRELMNEPEETRPVPEPVKCKPKGYA